MRRVNRLFILVVSLVLLAVLAPRFVSAEDESQPLGKSAASKKKSTKKKTAKRATAKAKGTKKAVVKAAPVKPKPVEQPPVAEPAGNESGEHALVTDMQLSLIHI